MSHNYHHQDPSFSYSQHNPPQQAASQQITLPPPPQPPPPPHHQPSIRMPPSSKAKKCRKRHPPVGPAGIWFLSRTGSKNNGKNKNNHNSRSNASASQDSTESSQPFANHNNSDNDDDEDEDALQHNSANSVGSNPAWMAMQCSLQWLTPDVSPSSAAVAALSHRRHGRHRRRRRRLLLTPWQRYQNLRPHVPRDVTLLPQLLHHNGNCSTHWKLQKGQKLVVLVHAITCHHDDIWTVELHDDTGSSIQAWIQPSFVHAERQRSSQENHNSNNSSNNGKNGPQYIRPGYVWCLEDVTVMLQQPLTVDDDEQENHNPDSSGGGTGTTAKRMLLISQRNVVQVWTPDSLQQIDETEFVQWMEQRDAFQRQWEEEHCQQPQNNNNNRSTGPNQLIANPPFGTNHKDDRRSKQGDNDDDDDEEPEEEDDDEDFYRRNLQQKQQRCSRFSNHGDDDDDGDEQDNNVIGGPKICSLHANSSMSSTRSTSNLPPTESQQQQQQQTVVSTTTPRARTTQQPIQELPSSSAETEEEDGTTAMFMRRVIDSLHPSSTQQTQQADQPLRLHQQPVSDGRTSPSQQQHQDQHRGNLCRQAQLSQVHPSQQPQRGNPYAKQPANHVTPLQAQQQPQQQRQVAAISTTWSQLNAPSPIVEVNAGAWSQHDGTSSHLPRTAQQPTEPAMALDNGKRDANKSRRVTFSQVPTSMQTPEEFNNILQDRENRQNRQPISNNPENVQQKEPLQKKNKAVDLNQFSAKHTTPAPKNTDAILTTKNQHTEPRSSESKRSSPTPSQKDDENKTPPKQRSSKDGQTKKRKRKKAKYDTSPLSQSPKPDASKLWTTTFSDANSGLLGASFLGLSSDEDDNEHDDVFARIVSNTAKQSTETTDPVAPQEPKSVKTADAHGVAPQNGNVNNSSGVGGVAALFQATFMPGIDWANLSDDDDDDD